MQAAVLTKPGQMLMQDLPQPECPEGGVLVAVRACGICSADAGMVRHGHRSLTYPRILGHEIVGVIQESRHKNFPPGTAVQIAPGLFCGCCRACLAGADHRCGHIEIFGFTRNGGFAEFVAVPLEGALRGSVQPIPDGLDFAVACLAEPLACCINAQDKLGITPQDTVCILGAGPLGLLHALLARGRNAENIIICDPRAERRRRARAFGLEIVLDTTEDSFPATIFESTQGRGVDVLILASRDAALDDHLLRLAAGGGRVSVFSGLAPALNTRPLNLNELHYRELSLCGAYGCSKGHNQKALEFISQNHHVDWAALITRRGPLSQIQDCFHLLKQENAFKTIVEVTP